MDKLKPCPFCEMEDKENETSRRKFYTPILKGIDYVGIACEKGTGKYYLHAESEDLDYSEDREIIACPVCGKALNRRPAPENKPLTLEQLRQMDGEPVWIDGKDYGGWTIFKASANKQVARCLDNVNLSYYMDDYCKTWLAYARKPEQEEHHA